MNLNLRALQQTAGNCAVVAMLGLVSTAAQAFPRGDGMGALPPGAAASMPSGPSIASLPAGSTKAYQGRFKSACMEMDEGLAFEDVLTLTPKDDKIIQVAMEKFFFSSSKCAPSEMLGSVIVPSGTWTLTGQAKLANRLVDEVIVELPKGKILINHKPGPKAKGRIEAVAENIRMTYGKEEMVVSNTSEATKDRALRWLGPDRMLLEDPTSPANGDYPSALLESMPFFKQP
jgi:hypothetical protein